LLHDQVYEQTWALAQSLAGQCLVMAQADELARRWLRPLSSRKQIWLENQREFDPDPIQTLIYLSAPA